MTDGIKFTFAADVTPTDVVAGIRAEIELRKVKVEAKVPGARTARDSNRMAGELDALAGVLWMLDRVEFAKAADVGPVVARLIRWRDVGDDPDPTYTAGNNQFASDVKILLTLAGYSRSQAQHEKDVAASRLDMPPPAPADAHPPRPDLGPDDHMEWAGFIIRRKTDRTGWQHRNPAYTVSENGLNPMPGATFFSSVADAKKGIAALTVARQIAPRPGAAVGLDGCDPDLFWMLLQLTGMRDDAN